MKIKLSQRAHYDTRGLPEGYDPGKLYQYRHETFEPQNGLEAFAHKLIPPSLMKSVAFAIDPTARFKVSPHAITPIQRTRYRSQASVLDARSRHGHVYDRSYSQISNYMGIALCSSPYFVDTNVYDSPDFPVDLMDQPVLPDYIKDTTSRNRLLGSLQGELEYFKHDLVSTPRTVIEKRVVRRYTVGVPSFDTCTAVGGKPDYEVGQDVDIRWSFHGASAVLPLDTYDALTASEVAFNKALAVSYAPKMLKAVSPFTRDYSLTRNAVELREIPRSITQLRDTMENLRRVFDSFGRSSSTRDLVFDLKRSSKDVPKEWLSYHFGWKQTYNDLVELLALPEKMSKKINFLISRSRKATTFRTKRNHLSGETGVSGFQYDTVTGFEYNQNSSSRIVRESELRLVVNAIFDFPPINVPSLVRTFTWYDRAGVIPRFIDIYNLTPWTWLFDWFTGLGNYLELIEEINHDPSLINWGMFTVHTKGKLLTDYYSEVPQSRLIHNNNIEVENSITYLGYRHQSRLEYECRTRSDVATLYDVKRTSVPSSLTAYQHSIIGAILSQRSGNFRRT